MTRTGGMDKDGATDMMRGLRRAAVLLPVVLLTAAIALPAAAKPPGAAAATPVRSFGVAVPGAPENLTELDRLTAELGRAPQSVTFYAAWATTPDFPADAVTRLAATGALPQVTWEPWDPAGGVSQPSYALSGIAAGVHDAYLTRWARQVRTYGKPVTIRLAHEMNGSWYPWSEQVNGNHPGDYVAAWRHVVDVFRDQRVRNVTWLWSPNVPYAGATALASLYPGDRYVDQVALDGYNWAGLLPDTSWVSFADLFGPGFGELDALSGRPMVVGEVGCPEVGGDKAAWVDAMFDWLSAHPEVGGLTWFDFAKEADWRIDSSAASLEAFRQRLATFE